jgi:hypothetical protein
MVSIKCHTETSKAMKLSEVFSYRLITIILIIATYRYLAATKFEPAYLRSAIPVYDEVNFDDKALEKIVRINLFLAVV